MDEANDEKRRVGRPMKKPQEGKRIPLGLRVTPHLKMELYKEAKRTGRSVSQEAEIRLERSFEREQILEAIAAVIDSHMYALMVADVMRGFNGEGDKSRKDILVKAAIRALATLTGAERQQAIKAILSGLKQSQSEMDRRFAQLKKKSKDTVK